jgi:hypothetical protein
MNSHLSPTSKAAVKLFFGNLIELTTDQLHYHKKDNSFSEEASTLDIKCGTKFDSFKVTNPKTNKFRIFMYSKTNYYGSGPDREIGSWEYKTDDGITLTIWND